MVNGIRIANIGEGTGRLVKLTPASDPLLSQTIIVLDGAGDLKTATAATDNTATCFLNVLDSEYSKRPVKEISVHEVKGSLPITLANDTDGSYTSADVGTICGLNATADGIDKANATALVKIIEVVSRAGQQEVYFKFI